MDIDQIRTFVTISQLKSFSRAADACIARSGPSAGASNCSARNWGASMFERVNGAIALIDAGLTLLPYVEAVLAAARDGMDAVKALNSGESGNVSVALVGTLIHRRNGYLGAAARRLLSAMIEQGSPRKLTRLRPAGWRPRSPRTARSGS